MLGVLYILPTDCRKILFPYQFSELKYRDFNLNFTESRNFFHIFLTKRFDILLRYWFLALSETKRITLLSKRSSFLILIQNIFFQGLNTIVKVN